MLDLFRKLQFRSSHISGESWHWVVTSFIWHDKAYGKACTYYWIKLPTAIPLFLVAWLFMLVFFVGVCAISWFFGFRPIVNHLKEGEYQLANRDVPFLPYKTSRKGTKYRFAPWEITLILALLFLVYNLVTNLDAATMRTLGIIIGVSFVLALIVWFIVKVWSRIKRFWNESCPMLVVEKSEE